jgi:hypothetical protein
MVAFRSETDSQPTHLTWQSAEGLLRRALTGFVLDPLQPVFDAIDL